MQNPKPKFWHEGDTLIAEWDNRNFARARYATLFSRLAWLLLLGIFCVACLSFPVLGVRSNIFIAFLSGAFVANGVILYWQRRCTERIEIGADGIAHRWLNLPNWFSRSDPWLRVKEISLSLDEDDPSDCDGVGSTRFVISGRRSYIVGKFANREFKKEVFYAIRNHLSAIGIDIPTYDFVPTKVISKVPHQNTE